MSPDFRHGELAVSTQRRGTGPTWGGVVQASGSGLLAFAHHRRVAERAPSRPWFAIGRTDESRLDDVLAAGAQRVVVVRAITEAATRAPPPPAWPSASARGSDRRGHETPTHRVQNDDSP